MNNDHKPMFTPGPWIVDSKNIRTAINSGEKHIAMVNIAKNPLYEITLEEHEANARLIAAAPRFFRALHGIATASPQKWGVSRSVFEDEFREWAQSLARYEIDELDGDEK